MKSSVAFSWLITGLEVLEVMDAPGARGEVGMLANLPWTRHTEIQPCPCFAPRLPSGRRQQRFAGQAQGQCLQRRITVLAYLVGLLYVRCAA
ncbi:hypothetical protein D3C80_1266520 [compost metagenome]